MPVAIQFDTSYLNKTPNHTVRPAAMRYVGVVWHETASPNPDNPHGTLRYNLRREVGSSYHFLIARDGTIFHYLDHREFTAWHAGVSSWTFDGTTYRNFELSAATVGIELDGKNNGTPCTGAQIESAARLRVWLYEQDGIPLDGPYDVPHRLVAPGRKTDPKGVSVTHLLNRARAMMEPNWQELWGDRATYEPTWGIPSEWRRQHAAGRPLGQAVTPELHHDAAKVAVQLFEQGAIVWSALGGAMTYRRDG